jgi:hypothetical protein
MRKRILTVRRKHTKERIQQLMGTTVKRVQDPDGTMRILRIVDATPETQEEPIGGPELPPPSEFDTLFDVTSTTLAKRLFPPEVIRKFKMSGTGFHSDGTKRLLDVRNIWVIGSNKSQCNNTVGPVVEGTTCWICGLKLEVDGIKNKDAGMAPQCEHVLPVAQGVLLVSLYNPCDKEECRADEGYKKFLTMEYGWSHTVCNQVKTNTVLLKSTDSGKMVAANDGKIKQMLSDIYNSIRKDSKSLRNALQTQYKGESKFVEQRLAVIKEQKLNPIIGYINSRLKQAPKLVLLSAIAHAVGRTREGFDDILMQGLAKQVEDVEKAVDVTTVDPLYTDDLKEEEKEEEFTYDVKEGAENLGKLRFMEVTSTSPSGYPPFDTHSPEQMRVADSLVRESYPPGPPRPDHRGGATHLQGYPRNLYRKEASGRT